MKKTKIVCTIGPKTESVESLKTLLKTGMNVMRLNFSHGDYEEHGNRIINFRQAQKETGIRAALLLDTKGPEIRTIKLEGGKDVTIVAIGNQVSKAMNIYRKLKENNIEAEVINARFLKPFDKYSIIKSIAKTKFVVTIEDNTLVGGLGSEVKEIIAEKHMANIKIKTYGYPDVFVEHGTPNELEEIYKLDEKSIFEYIKNSLSKKEKKAKEKLQNYVEQEKDEKKEKIKEEDTIERKNVSKKYEQKKYKQEREKKKQEEKKEAV